MTVSDAIAAGGGTLMEKKHGQAEDVEPLGV